MEAAISNGCVYGYIKDADTGEPILYANIILKEHGVGTTTNNQGFYTIPNIPMGRCTIQIFHMGYKNIEEAVSIVPNTDQRLDLELKETLLQLDDVIVSGTMQHQNRELGISTINLNTRELRIAPAFVEADIFRTIQMLPGVQPPNDFSSSLRVRGGNPDENLLMLDGIEVYNPYHLGGVFSTFNTDAIADVEFLAGGFPAEYGNRLSSVLSFTGREGNSRRKGVLDNTKVGKFIDISQAEGEVNLLSSKILVEGPIYKGSWLVSVRRTYFDKIAEIVYWAIDEPMNWQYYFYDIYGKIIQNIDARNRISLSHFEGMDRVFFNITQDELDATFDWDWGNKTNSAEWRWVPNSKFLSTLSISNTNYYFDVSLGMVTPDSARQKYQANFSKINRIMDRTLQEKIEWIPSSYHRFTLGIEFKNIETELHQGLDDDGIIVRDNTEIIQSGYIQNRWQLNSSFSLTSGLRVSDYSAHAKKYFEPRFGAKWILSNDLSIKGFWGKYNQFLSASQDDNTIISIVDFWDLIPNNYEARSVGHYILGLEKWLGDSWQSTIEIYYKRYEHTLEINPIQSPSNPLDDFVQGSGKILGSELYLKKSLGKITGWLGLSFSSSLFETDFNGDGHTKENDGEIYRSKYDQPYSLQIVANYLLAPKHSFGFTLSSSSANTFTPAIGYTYTQNGKYSDISNPYSTLSVLRGRRNSARYPSYFRADVSYSFHTIFLKKNVIWKLQVINITNHFNTLLYNYDLAKTGITATGMFPIFPTLGIEFKL